MEWIMRKKKVKNVDKLFEILETECQTVSKIIWQKKKGVKKAKQIDWSWQIYDQISYSFIKT